MWGACLLANQYRPISCSAAGARRQQGGGGSACCVGPVGGHAHILAPWGWRGWVAVCRGGPNQPLLRLVDYEAVGESSPPGSFPSFPSWVLCFWVGLSGVTPSGCTRLFEPRRPRRRWVAPAH